MSSIDPLSQFIKKLSPECNIFAQIQLREPWGIEEATMGYCSFSYLRKGSCWIQVEEDTPFQLHSGQMIVLPYGTNHKAMSDPSVACEQADDLFSGKSIEDVEAMIIGGDGVECQLMCGNFIFSPLQYWGEDPVSGGLPKVIILDAKHSSRLNDLLIWLYQENSQISSGSDLAIKHMLELLFLELLRNLGQDEWKTGWLNAISDRRLATVVLAIQTQYQKDWKLIELASLAALSKTAFTNRFKEVANSSPLQYLRQWRCLVAAQQLAQGQESVKVIALNCGFQSADVFIRNFKKFHHMTPNQYREKTQKKSRKNTD